VICSPCGFLYPFVTFSLKFTHILYMLSETLPSYCVPLRLRIAVRNGERAAARTARGVGADRQEKDHEADRQPAGLLLLLQGRSLAARPLRRVCMVRYSLGIPANAVG
jgi:hypothetical protein